MTGQWTLVCTKQVPVMVDVAQLNSIVETLCTSQIQPETITNIRLTVTSITGTITGVGTRDLTLPSGKLEIPISPLAIVHAGATTTIVVDLQPHIVCQGNGDCKLTPVLRAGPESKG